MRPSVARRRRASITCSCNRSSVALAEAGALFCVSVSNCAAAAALGVSSLIPLHTKNPSDSHHFTKTDPPLDIITRLKELQAILFLDATRSVSSNGGFAMSHVTIPPDLSLKPFIRFLY